jgi:hypothetical protein
MQIAYTSKNGLQLPESMGYGFIGPFLRNLRGYLSFL